MRDMLNKMERNTIKKALSIKNKGKTAIILIFFFIVVLFFSITFFYTTHNTRELIIKSYHEIAVKQYEYIENLMEHNIEIIESIARNKVIIDFMMSKNHLTGLKNCVNIKEYIDITLEENEECEKFQFIDADGDLIFDSNPEKNLIENTEFFKEIIKTDDIFISNAEKIMNEESQWFTQPISYPIYSEIDEQGHIAGFIVAYYNMDIIDDSLSIIDVGKDGTSYLVDSNGRVLCSSRGYEYQINIGNFSDYYVSNSYYNTSKGYRLVNPETGRLVASVMKCLDTRHGGVDIYKNHQNLSVIGVWKWMSIFNWIFIIEISEDEAFAPIKNTIVVYLVIAALFTVIFAFIIYLNHSLEIKVNKKTEELEAAYSELQAINDSLIEARNEIWGEMQLAKRIQTILLPQKINFTGYETCAYMRPADSIGGDYYDFIHAGDKHWLVIGDVSGHGVPAGLIMMMVQTSIHSMLQQNPDLEPAELISLVNRTIRNNLTQMQEDKYMSLTTLACDINGVFTFSGLHQNILIYRFDRNIVEPLQTEGIWLGVMDDIDHFLFNHKFTLGVDDIMLLFTDGITEAWEKGTIKDNRSMEFNMYGENRLRDLLQNSSHKNVQEIKADILKSLVKFQLDDDVTFMIFKKTK